MAVFLAFSLLRSGIAVLLPIGSYDGWEGPALPDAWDDVDGYLDFRTYALDPLSDLGFLDVVLDDLQTFLPPSCG